MRSRYPRLSLSDISLLKFENANTPEHIAGLCLIEAAPLHDGNGELDLEMIKRRLERRLLRVPELRRILHWAPPLCGPPLWVDDPCFSIDHHVHVAAVESPGDEPALLETAAVLLRPLLDRSHPLWELWFLTGLQNDRFGMLFKIHHAVGDGLATVGFVASLLDAEPDAPDPPAEPRRAAPVPAACALLVDSMRARLAAAAAALSHPVQLGHSVVSTVSQTRRLFALRAVAARTALNRTAGPIRHNRVVRLDLDAARAMARAHGAKVNDVVLTVVMGGVRELLIMRGEPIRDVKLSINVPAALPTVGAHRSGNAAGGFLVQLPAGEVEAFRRLELTAKATRAAKANQQPDFISSAMGCITAAGLGPFFARHQKMINFLVTNVPGPTVPLYLLGARIEDVMPIVGLFGNVVLNFAALSYCGRLNVVATADAVACPDVDILAAAMKRTWGELAGDRASQSRTLSLAAAIR